MNYRRNLRRVPRIHESLHWKSFWNRAEGNALSYNDKLLFGKNVAMSRIWKARVSRSFRFSVMLGRKIDFSFHFLFMTVKSSEIFLIKCIQNTDEINALRKYSMSLWLSSSTESFARLATSWLVMEQLLSWNDRDSDQFPIAFDYILKAEKWQLTPVLYILWEKHCKTLP